MISDRSGYFHSNNANRSGVSRILVREVMIEVQENGQATTVRLITNLFDISAKDVGVLSRMALSSPKVVRVDGFALRLWNRRLGVLRDGGK